MPLSNCLQTSIFKISSNTLRDRYGDKAEHEIPKPKPPNMQKLAPSRLLSLPKELRLCIWEHVLTDPSSDRVLVNVLRNYKDCANSSKRFSNSLYKSTSAPQFLTIMESHRHRKIYDFHLLCVSRMIYEEALPILYKSITLCPYNIQGTFSLFLERFSPFALSNLRYITLDISSAFNNAGSLFYWAMTCAQVTKLSESLRQVDVVNYWPLFDHSPFVKRAVLHPLLKISTPKKFLPEESPKLKHLLDEARQEMKIKSEKKEAKRIYRVHEITTGNRSPPPGYSEPAQKKQMGSDGLAIRNRLVNAFGIPLMDEREIANDLGKIPGIENFEEELSEWDMVSRGSRSPDRTTRSESGVEDDMWTEAASTIVGKEDDPDDDKVDEEWEIVKNPS